MKTSLQIYDQYKLVSALKIHQLRVASVAKMICDHMAEKADRDNVILACLFHDMGNIIKSNFDHFPDFLEPQGLQYWQSVKDEYIKKYGPSEHHAALMIAKEIGLPPRAIELIEKIKFSNLSVIENNNSIENKICSYADMRVGPYGVISIEERLSDGQRRYGEKLHTIVSEGYETLSESLRRIEKDVCARSNLKPEDINDDAIKTNVEELGSYPIK